ncbi:MAG: hypothetical protein KatS3mg131_0064 [Candidatus Tectimicrobiota bacterium]|nr:MAG: hypothetical protein KatS3mg131_0064 [Candidatus Tectomicrobia bacterium]
MWRKGKHPLPVEQLLRGVQERLQRARYGEDRPGRTAARPPQQPPSGPGGADYGHRQVQSHRFGEGDQAYWLFEPQAPRPPIAPLVIFLHGWGGVCPVGMSAWIDHLVRRGNLVLFPVYQSSLRTPATTMLSNTLAAVKAALQRLQSGVHVRPDLERVAAVGHSLGGALAAQVAAMAPRLGLPAPKALMPVAPGRGLWALNRSLPPVDLRTIPTTTLLLVVVCEEDKNAGDYEGKVIFTQTPQIPLENKNFVVVRSDDHGTPPLVANHRSPTAVHPAYGALSTWTETDEKWAQVVKQVLGEGLPTANALHYYGYWKLFDALMEAAFAQRHREYALGNTPQQRFMGRWSDGVPVRELLVITCPEQLASERLLEFRFRQASSSGGT